MNDFVSLRGRGTNFYVHTSNFCSPPIPFIPMTRRVLVNTEVVPDGGNLPGEIWKPIAIENFGEYYHVSNMGRVMRVKSASGGTHPGFILKGCINSRFGYNHYDLYTTPRESTKFSGHALVMITFVGERPSKYNEINHKNGVKTDNRLSNLEYVSSKQNQIHAYKNGIAKRKLTHNDVRKIRKLWSESNLTCAAIGDMFGVSSTHIHDIMKGKVWKYLDDFTPPTSKERRKRVSRNIISRHQHD